jgi:hypothetical protein
MRLFLAMTALCVAGCGTWRPAYNESDDLLVIQHNTYNDYLLMVYRDVLGQTRHVLRRGGICEVVLTYELDGSIRLKTRGKRERKIDAYEAGRLTLRINSLLRAREEGGEVLTSI